jgi:hypothetical protein
MNRWGYKNYGKKSDGEGQTEGFSPIEKETGMKTLMNRRQGERHDAGHKHCHEKRKVELLYFSHCNLNSIL